MYCALFLNVMIAVEYVRNWNMMIKMVNDGFSVRKNANDVSINSV